jgi:hypothetical protein
MDSKAGGRLAIGEVRAPVRDMRLAVTMTRGPGGSSTRFAFPLDKIEGPPQLVDGTEYPSRFTCEIGLPGEPVLVVLTIGYLDGQWVAEALQIVRGPLTKARIRTVAAEIDQLITEAVLCLSTMRPRIPAGPPDEVVEEAIRRRQRRRHITDDLLQEVAEIYLAADHAPAAAVKDHLQMSAAQVSRYIAAARERGFLPEWQRSGEHQ